MFRFWYRWLLAIFTFYVLFGVVFALGSGSGLFAPLVDRLNEHFFGSAALSAEAARFQLFAYGIAGALTAALGEVCFFITRYAIARREVWGWNAIVAGLALWYVVDGAISAYTGAYLNVVSNTMFGLLAAVPLVAIRRHLHAAYDQVAATG